MKALAVIDMRECSHDAVDTMDVDIDVPQLLLDVVMVARRSCKQHVPFGDVGEQLVGQLRAFVRIHVDMAIWQADAVDL